MKCVICFNKVRDDRSRVISEAGETQYADGEKEEKFFGHQPTAALLILPLFQLFFVLVKYVSKTILLRYELPAELMDFLLISHFIIQ